MHTEKQASKKMCCGPLAAMNTSQGLCIGPACMAWRWQAGAFDDYGTLKVKNKAGYVVVAEGFCGLAGRPE